MRKMFGLGELDTAMRGTLINNILGSSAKMRHFQMADRPKSVVLHGEFKASMPQTCPSSLLKAPLHDLVGASHRWVGSFIQYECGQRNPFHLCIP